MKERHLALVVEDDPETAEDLGQILESVDCGSVVVDNAEDAKKRLQEKSFCLILLDLQIKSAPDEIKGHVEYGKRVLRTIRATHPDHNGKSFTLPVLIVSGFAKERDEAVDVMKSGATDIIEKPLGSGRVSERIRQALQDSGRRTHDACGGLATPSSHESTFAIVIVCSSSGAVTQNGNDKSCLYSVFVLRLSQWTLNTPTGYWRRLEPLN